MTRRTALVGHTGFVGGVLKARRPFDALYNSANIDRIAGERFDRVVCAGAPATMWAANNDPEGDKANLDRLAAALRSASIGTLVLISTVAVFDDASAGYDETNARYEEKKAYGRHRRALEVQAADLAEQAHVLRLPALFGPGLKKNFIFDLLNPAPSFINGASFEKTQAAFTPAERAALEAAYVFEAGLKMWRLKREEIAGTPLMAELVAALARIGFLSRSFTNSESRYQFYNMERLADDIDAAIAAKIGVLNICSEPMSAREVHQALTGEDFENAGPGRVNEDVRTVHAAAFGASAPYLFDRAAVMKDLKAYFQSARTA